MPRTTTVECPGCPPIRALTCDVLGLIKVIEAHGKQGGVPQVVERWGEPDSSNSILAASINDRKFHPLLAVARKSRLIEVLSPINGELHASIPNANEANDSIVGLHLFRKQSSETSSRSCTLFTCTTKGKAGMRSIEVSKSPADSCADPSHEWNVCTSGDVLCSKVDSNENYALFGGKRIEVNLWDLHQCTKIWTAKSPAKNSLGIFTPTCFTSATFLSRDDHRKFVAGTNSHEVRLYDIAAQRRPVISFNFRETAIKAVAEDPDGHTIYIGNGSGDLASVDIRTGKLLGCFLGKCSGSIRSIVRHPELPVVASCGLDSYIRFWDVSSRQLLSAVFLKQHLTNVVLDTHFVDEAQFPPTEPLVANELVGDEEELHLVRRYKSSKEDNRSKKLKSMKGTHLIPAEPHEKGDVVDGDDEETLPVKRKKASKEDKGIKRLKSRKNTHLPTAEERVTDEIEDTDDEDLLPVKQKKASKEENGSKKLKAKKKSKKPKSKDIEVS